MVSIPLLVAIAGPTGSGKSDLAIAIAAQLDGEIINCDSVQMYRGFDIGAAKVPPSERHGIPHHLFDILDPAEVSTAGDYARKARETLREVTQRGKLPVLAGGTGFYLRALIDGLFEGPSRDEALRQRLQAREALRPGSLHRILLRLDPATAGRVHARDVKKVIRALEIRLLSTQPASRMFDSGRDRLEGFRTLKICLNPDREELRERLDRRASEIFSRGLLDEVRNLLAAGVTEQAKPFESIGYAQALRHLRGEITLAEAIESTRIATRQYAKRQRTWFRRERDVFWIDGFGGDPEVQAQAITQIKLDLNMH